MVRHRFSFFSSVCESFAVSELVITASMLLSCIKIWKCLSKFRRSANSQAPTGCASMLWFWASVFWGVFEGLWTGSSGSVFTFTFGLRISQHANQIIFFRKLDIALPCKLRFSEENELARLSFPIRYGTVDMPQKCHLTTLLRRLAELVNMLLLVSGPKTSKIPGTFFLARRNLKIRDSDRTLVIRKTRKSGSSQVATWKSWEFLMLVI